MSVRNHERERKARHKVLLTKRRGEGGGGVGRQEDRMEGGVCLGLVCLGLACELITGSMSYGAKLARSKGQLETYTQHRTTNTYLACI